ncbi:hypothetical protein [Paenibacillus sp. FJAT-26967]|uniref:hypothetical protein n=1 Tax=Paenibacillus sp. FJAT-26967 TaxID=1729690 RepID=UPI0020A5054F|nr:hypothetical protein [Paenibacillus sp. FJAT-26967]
MRAPFIWLGGDLSGSFPSGEAVGFVVGLAEGAGDGLTDGDGDKDGAGVLAGGAGFNEGSVLDCAVDIGSGAVVPAADGLEVVDWTVVFPESLPGAVSEQPAAIETASRRTADAEAVLFIEITLVSL